jgi:hypothetical protein
LGELIVLTLKTFVTVGIITASLSACNLAALFEEPTEGELAARALVAAADGGAFGTQGAEAVAIYNEVRNLGTSSPSQIPDNLKASYTGVLGIGSASDGVIGDLSLIAVINPTSAFIEGGADEFVDALGRDAKGALTISRATLDVNADPEEQWMFDAQIRGEIFTQTGQTSRNVSGLFSGEFVGNGADHISGEIRGDAANPGFFAAERVVNNPI